MKYHTPAIEYTVIWHGASWREDFHPLPAPTLNLATHHTTHARRADAQDFQLRRGMYADKAELQTLSEILRKAENS